MPVDQDNTASLAPKAIRDVIADALLPAHFFAGPGIALEWEHPSTEELPWEIFQGRLLERALTRQTRTFEVWNIHTVEGGARSAEPLLAVMLDLAAGELHVTRGLLCYVWEGYHAGDNVYLSRETTRWVRELVGTIPLARLRDSNELRADLTGCLFAAVVGVSRLPLTSVEAPLPAFALGQLAYFYCPQSARDGGPMRSWPDLLAGALTEERSWTEIAKLHEALLRATPAEELDQAAARLVERWRELDYTLDNLLALLRTVFNEISLSPWTDFVKKALRLVNLLVEGGHLGVAEQAEFLGYLLRQLTRHVTAYNLVTFHHRGANYPDALLLDLVLKEYLRLIERHAELFAKREGRQGRLLRRALRQGYLLRRHYEGLLVPDAPTSPGENARVLPPPHQRVPLEQIVQVVKRTRRLYQGDPLPGHLGEQSRRVLRQSGEDLRHWEELQELGMAVFIDRPLGVFKAPGESDQTVLLSYAAFSKALAAQRLEQLARDDALGLCAEEVERLREELLAWRVEDAPWVPLTAVGRETRPVVSLADALKVSEDFALVHALPRGVREFLRDYDFSELRKRFDLDYLADSARPLVVRGLPRRGEGPLLAVYDFAGRKRLELAIEARQGYVSRGGAEYPGGGLRVLRVWEAEGTGRAPVERDLSTEGLVIFGGK
jgi:hypothetical protein